MTKITEITCKQALNKINSKYLPFEWDLNIYRGCGHGCVYCYAIYSHKYLNQEANYYNDIYVKVNIVQQLEKQLSNPYWKRERINIGGVTDSYQPLEAKYRLMPQILNLLIKYKTPCSISTKSDLLLRDIDLIEELSKVADVSIGATITTPNNNIRKILEPGAKNATEKFTMLKELAKRNIKTGLHHMPIIPYITDNLDDIEALYKNAHESNVSYLIPGIMYLRGKTYNVFFDFIKKAYPHLYEDFLGLYSKGNMAAYKANLYKMLNPIRNKYNLNNNHQLKKSSPLEQKLSKTSTKPTTINLNPFVELEIAAKNNYNVVDSSVQKSIAEPIIQDTKRAFFQQMRQLGHDISTYDNPSKVFYTQGMFMKDFEDDYEDYVSFFSYFPRYSQMSYIELRSYFTWRTNLKKGKTSHVSLSYAFIYIYELINLIGKDTPAEALEELVSFWQTYRKLDSGIDSYIYNWFLDFHIYYTLPHSFVDFVTKHNLTYYYPTIFAYYSTKENSLDIFSHLSSYNIKNSTFYKNENILLVNHCFYYLIKTFDKELKSHNLSFLDLILVPFGKKTRWTPFSRAIFYAHQTVKDKEIIISPTEKYMAQNNKWSYISTTTSDSGRQFVGYIIKEIEKNLRNITSFKHKLKSNNKNLGSYITNLFLGFNIDLQEFIKTNVEGFYIEYTRKIITVDTKNLDNIREKSLITQNKLIIEEDKPSIVSQIKPNITSPIKKTTTDPWVILKDSLTQAEQKTLKLLIKNESLTAFALEQMIMPEILIDNINTKAIDIIGDAIIDTDNGFSIYDDYIAKIKNI